jgi:hypothetical protein
LNRKAPVVISTMCSHTEDDPEFEIYEHHCVSGMIGQLKPAALLLHDPARQMLFPKHCSRPASGSIVTDAVKSLSESAGAEMLSDFVAAGGRLITAGEVR